MKKDIEIILFCLKNIGFCRHASQLMTPIPTDCGSMQRTYEGLSKVFSGLGEDFEIIAKMVGLQFDLTGQKGEIILEKINSMPTLDKVQLRKCMKEIRALLS